MWWKIAGLGEVLLEKLATTSVEVVAPARGGDDQAVKGRRTPDDRKYYGKH